MLARLLTILSSAVAIGFGLFIVVGLLLGANIGTLHIFRVNIAPYTVTTFLIEVTMITVAVTILIGILNLFLVHLRRVARRSGGWVYSLALVVSAAAVLILWIARQDAANSMLVETVQVSVESALAGLVVFALVYGAYRLMRRRVTWSGMLFTLVLLIILVGALPLPQASALTRIRAWLLAVPVSAGARGILLGIALATVVTGVRVLVGQDRSYRE